MRLFDCKLWISLYINFMVMPIPVIRTPANPLLLCDGFRPDFVKPCLMHCVHLGALQLHNGSIITLLDEAGFLANCTRIQFDPQTPKLRLVWRHPGPQQQDDRSLRPLQILGQCEPSEASHILTTLYLFSYGYMVKASTFPTMPCPAKAFAGHHERWFDEL